MIAELLGLEAPPPQAAFAADVAAAPRLPQVRTAGDGARRLPVAKKDPRRLSILGLRQARKFIRRSSMRSPPNRDRRDWALSTGRGPAGIASLAAAAVA